MKNHNIPTLILKKLKVSPTKRRQKILAEALASTILVYHKYLKLKDL